jgi:uncharacterized circularly permuted ATP-grasp superfamily protein
VALAGLVSVRQGDETRRFDLRLSDKEIVLPTTEETRRMDITFTRADDPDPRGRLL